MSPFEFEGACACDDDVIDKVGAPTFSLSSDVVPHRVGNADYENAAGFFWFVGIVSIPASTQSAVVAIVM